MSYFFDLVDIFLHLDKHLNVFAAEYGAWTLALLFLIVFCETGLVVMPFLPGDSLLFAAGALTVQGFFGVPELLLALTVAAILGDAVNYHIGKYVGPKVFHSDSRFLKRAHIERTQRFFEKYGGKTIIIARFVPIVRTFAPFLAGVGIMSYPRFLFYNVTGALLWVLSFVLAGHYFANVEIVKNNFTVVILAIIAISLLPVVLELWRAKHIAAAVPTAAQPAPE